MLLEDLISLFVGLQDALVINGFAAPLRRFGRPGYWGFEITTSYSFIEHDSRVFLIQIDMFFGGFSGTDFVNLYWSSSHVYVCPQRNTGLRWADFQGVQAMVPKDPVPPIVSLYTETWMHPPPANHTYVGCSPTMTAVYVPHTTGLSRLSPNALMHVSHAVMCLARVGFCPSQHARAQLLTQLRQEVTAALGLARVPFTLACDTLWEQLEQQGYQRLGEEQTSGQRMLPHCAHMAVRADDQAAVLAALTELVSRSTFVVEDHMLHDGSFRHVRYGRGSPVRFVLWFLPPGLVLLNDSSLTDTAHSSVPFSVALLDMCTPCTVCQPPEVVTSTGQLVLDGSESNTSTFCLAVVDSKTTFVTTCSDDPV